MLNGLGSTSGTTRAVSIDETIHRKQGYRIMSVKSSNGILSGYRVLDCSIAMAGPFAAQRLGDLGADVVKIEPVGGEWQRHVSAGGHEGTKSMSPFFR